MRVSAAVAQYVARMNGSGYAFVQQAYVLSSFCRAAGDPELRSVAADDLMRYLNRGEISSGTWRNKYSILSRFFQFWYFRQEMPPVTLPPPRPRTPQLFVPYIYSKAEIRRLLQTVDACQSHVNCSISPFTLKSLIVTLYATGARLGEVLSLRSRDLENSGILHIGGTSRGLRRRLPINRELQTVLLRNSEDRLSRSSTSGLLFLNEEGRRISEATLRHNYARLCKLAGVSRRYGKEFRPRLNDFRATFAVHRITSWIRYGADLNRMLPALAAYMGHAGLGTTAKYLQRTPERFREQLNLLSPKRSQQHWRDNTRLMSRLAAL